MHMEETGIPLPQEEVNNVHVPQEEVTDIPLAQEEVTDIPLPQEEVTDVPQDFMMYLPLANEAGKALKMAINEQGNE